MAQFGIHAGRTRRERSGAVHYHRELRLPQSLHDRLEIGATAPQHVHVRGTSEALYQVGIGLAVWHNQFGGDGSDRRERGLHKQFLFDR